MTAGGDLGPLTVSVSGGNGGAGASGAFAGSGGSGGIGLDLTSGAGTAIEILSTVQVQGGNGGSDARGASNGAAGLGGAGIVGANLSIINSGSITGGKANAGQGDQADAIDFTGGENSLTLNTAAANGGMSGGLGLGGTVTITPDAGGTTLTNVLHDYGPVKGTLVKAGDGTLTLTGTNTYTGGTVIRAGTLVAGVRTNYDALNELGSGTVTLDGGALSFNQNGATDFNNDIYVDGGGGYIHSGPSSVVLNGHIYGANLIDISSDSGLYISGDNSSFRGTMRFSSGRTYAGSENSLSSQSAVQIASGAAVLLNEGTRTIGSLSDYGGAGGIIGDGHLITGGDGSSTNFSGVVSDIYTDTNASTTSFTKVGSGTQILSGRNTYTGATTVSAGTLLVDGSTAAASAVTVANGATLGGAGTVNGAVDLSGALSASAAGFGTPGTGPSYGTLTTGALSMENGSSLVEEIGGRGAGQYDTVAVNGTAMLGGTLNLSLAAPTDSADGDTFTVLTATAIGTGRFANTTTTSAGRTFQIGYTANSVTLTDVTPTPAAPTIEAPANGTATNDAEPTISGTGETGDTVNLSIVRQGGATTTATATVTGGSWSYTPAGALADGTYSVTATQTNPGQNTSAASNIETFTVDTTAPTVTSIADADNGNAVAGVDYLNAGKVATFTATSSEPVVISGGAPTATLNDGGVATYDAAASTPTSFVFDYTVQANQDTQSLAVIRVQANGATVTDQAGNPLDLDLANTRRPANTIVVDTTDPAVAITSPGGTTTTASQTITGTVMDANPGQTVFLFDNGSTTPFAQATLDAQGNFSAAVTLMQGTNSITAQDADLAGNTGTSGAVVYMLVNSPASGDGGSTPAGPTLGDDNLVGTAGPDTVSLLAGNDRYSGLGGADLIYGNQGNDLVYGNQGNDTVFGGQDDDTAYGGQGSDMLYGNRGDDVVYGNLGDDRLYGGQGSDTLYGGMGDDVLFGNKGADVLVGGLGSDTFAFNPGDTDFRSMSGTGDTIADFVSGTDSIDFTGGPAATSANFGSAATTSTDFAAIQQLAQQILGGGKSYAFVADGQDGFLFTTGGSGTSIADAVKLTGAGSQASLRYQDIHAGAVA